MNEQDPVVRTANLYPERIVGAVSAAALLCGVVKLAKAFKAPGSVSGHVKNTEWTELTPEELI